MPEVHNARTLLIVNFNKPKVFTFPQKGMTHKESNILISAIE